MSGGDNLSHRLRPAPRAKVAPAPCDGRGESLRGGPRMLEAPLEREVPLECLLRKVGLMVDHELTPVEDLDEGIEPRPHGEPDQLDPERRLRLPAGGARAEHVEEPEAGGVEGAAHLPD